MAKEDFSERGVLIGDFMHDAFLECSDKKTLTDIELYLLSDDLSNVSEIYCYLTCHHEEKLILMKICRRFSRRWNNWMCQ